MARYTSAYSALMLRFDEVETLRVLAAKFERKDPVENASKINALSRSAIVMLSGHIEGYVKDLGELALDSLHSNQEDRSKIASRFFYHLSRKVVEEIHESRDPGVIAEKVFNFLGTESPQWGRSGPFPNVINAERFNLGFSNPAFQKICSYINRFGHQDFKRDLQQALQMDFQVCVNMIDNLVELRNQIAHGTLGVTDTPAQLKDKVRIGKTFCLAVDRSFANWWKTKFATIR